MKPAHGTRLVRREIKSEEMMAGCVTPASHYLTADLRFRSFRQGDEQHRRYQPRNPCNHKPAAIAPRRARDGPHGVGSNKSSEIAKAVNEGNSGGC